MYITLVSGQIIETLHFAYKPLSIKEITTKLKNRGISAHFSSVFRQLRTLHTLGQVTITLGSTGKKYFEELKAGEVHLHTVCPECDSVVCNTDLPNSTKTWCKKQHIYLLQTTVVCESCKLSLD
jgi:Fe2+ or Zn2+ uptake regulation protein